MATSSRSDQYKLASERARKIREILVKNQVTFGEALSHASEMFQILVIMGEVNPMLGKALAYLAVKLQDTELDKLPLTLDNDGLFNQRQLSTPSSETLGDVSKESGNDGSISVEES